jgi:prepilin-type processing-associated H-X9-DG protein
MNALSPSVRNRPRPRSRIIKLVFPRTRRRTRRPLDKLAPIIKVNFSKTSTKRALGKLALTGQTGSSTAGFTLVELLVLLACLAAGSFLLTTASAHTGPNVRALQCLNNLRQMQVGWRVYASDSADVMLPNAPLGGAGGVGSGTWCGIGSESWAGSSYNTNPAPYLAALFAPYIENQISLYKCPGDVIPSSNGPRIRSYSMQGQMGCIYDESIVLTYNPGYVAYVKVSDLSGGLPPANALVFCEENMCSLNDGFLQVQSSPPEWPDVPGSYHNGAMGASFADGHVELHQWATSALLIPVRFGFGYPGHSVIAPAGNADWIWWTNHTTTPNPQLTARALSHHQLITIRPSVGAYMECGGKRSATPLSSPLDRSKS